MILFVFAVPEESREFREENAFERVKGGPCDGDFAAGGNHLIHCGIGAAAVARIVPQRLAALTPECVVAAGFAGAVDPELEIADLVVDEGLSDPALRAGVWSEIFIPGKIISVSQPAETVEAKRALAAQGGLAVDMETAAIAAACRAAGVPLLAVRAISDRAEEPLPVPFRVWFDLQRQKPRVVSLLAFLLAHPRAIPRFVRFVGGLKSAAQTLGVTLSLWLTSQVAADARHRRN